MPRLPLARRLTAAFSSALLLQLSLLASGPPCQMPGEPQAAQVEAATAGHQAMHLAGTPYVASVASVPVAGAPAPQSSACDMSASHRSCHVPCAPEDCAIMSGCAGSPPVLPSGAVAVATIVQTTLVAPARVLIPSGPTFAPEPPPPRA